MSYAHLTDLPANTFRKLSSLQELILSRTPLASVDVHAFDGLTQLLQLDLSCTQRLSELPDAVCEPLTSLQTLNLSKWIDPQDHEQKRKKWQVKDGCCFAITQ